MKPWIPTKAVSGKLTLFQSCLRNPVTVLDPHYRDKSDRCQNPPSGHIGFRPGTSILIIRTAGCWIWGPSKTLTVAHSHLFQTVVYLLLWPPYNQPTATKSSPSVQAVSSTNHCRASTVSPIDFQTIPLTSLNLLYLCYLVYYIPTFKPEPKSCVTGLEEPATKTDFLPWHAPINPCKTTLFRSFTFSW